ncbi:hypothetical protein [Caulobacter hibisci]|uniref:Uncharacterized protein n=1 Tax=Caulobacter hibisci TaxID=2035993 RepID=A0ABS0SRC3_9CAUL|nr:hypothetical protein [Caulobacter hibisci]MBI1682135.1 hypothetical protein [Caulobacter hibisci]
MKPSTVHRLGMGGTAAFLLPFTAFGGWLLPGAWVLGVLLPLWLVFIWSKSRCRSCGLHVNLQDCGPNTSSLFRYRRTLWPSDRCSRCGADV